MPAPAGEFLGGLALYVGPDCVVATVSHLGDFVVGLVAESSDEIAAVVAEGQCAVLPWSRHPSRLVRFHPKLCMEGLPLLHPLYKRLQTSGQFQSQIILRHFIARIGHE